MLHALAEAAAVTAMLVDGEGPPSQPTAVHVDRPFFLLIRNIPTGTALFSGRVLDPSISPGSRPAGAPARTSPGRLSVQIEAGAKLAEIEIEQRIVQLAHAAGSLYALEGGSPRADRHPPGLRLGVELVGGVLTPIRANLAVDEGSG